MADIGQQALDAAADVFLGWLKSFQYEPEAGNVACPDFGHTSVSQPYWVHYRWAHPAVMSLQAFTSIRTTDTVRV